jgi:hypothetical protein
MAERVGIAKIDLAVPIESRQTSMVQNRPDNEQPSRPLLVISSPCWTTAVFILWKCRSVNVVAVRAELANFKKFRRLTDQWVGLALQRADWELKSRADSRTCKIVGVDGSWRTFLRLSEC